MAYISNRQPKFRVSPSASSQSYQVVPSSSISRDANFFTLAKKFWSDRHAHRFCSNWRCTFSNPQQAAAGRYICLGCRKGTYNILPEDAIGPNGYTISNFPVRNEQAHTISRFFWLDRRQREKIRENYINEEYPVRAIEDVSVPRYVQETRRNKYLPGTPGLDVRRHNGPPIGAVRVQPPQEDSYFQPLRAQHSTASRNLLARRPLYDLNDSPALPDPRPMALGYSRRQPENGQLMTPSSTPTSSPQKGRPHSRRSTTHTQQMQRPPPIPFELSPLSGNPNPRLEMRIRNGRLYL
ncbi:hypothetical protein BDN70DRAFT_983286 [Pholiota conissans]|uniref:Uncharacterized protein n=1 Tax=Pholiota conissans TaxID=109636 RepID=A0A9P6D1E5_9AGAR|nr:hypothetical protein BDN70DRAFT_983286 [Pholiota conissans]